MRTKQELWSIDELKEVQSTGAGYNILRYMLVPELLGREKDTILYFMGKKLARKFELSTYDDVYHLFRELGFGQLELVKQKRSEQTFCLVADSVARRLNAPFTADFRVEAGLLAEAIEQIDGRHCECREEINQKIFQVTFTVYYTD